MKTKILIKILELSKKKNGGDKPVTIGHLLNMIKLVNKIEKRMEKGEILENQDLINAVMEHGQK